MLSFPLSAISDRLWPHCLRYKKLFFRVSCAAELWKELRPERHGQIELWNSTLANKSEPCGGRHHLIRRYARVTFVAFVYPCRVHFCYPACCSKVVSMSCPWRSGRSSFQSSAAQLRALASGEGGGAAAPLDQLSQTNQVCGLRIFIIKRICFL